MKFLKFDKVSACVNFWADYIRYLTIIKESEFPHKSGVSIMMRTIPKGIVKNSKIQIIQSQKTIELFIAKNEKRSEYSNLIKKYFNLKFHSGFSAQKYEFIIDSFIVRNDGVQVSFDEFIEDIKDVNTPLTKYSLYWLDYHGTNDNYKPSVRYTAETVGLKTMINKSTVHISLSYIADITSDMKSLLDSLEDNESDVIFELSSKDYKEVPFGDIKTFLTKQTKQSCSLEQYDYLPYMGGGVHTLLMYKGKNNEVLNTKTLYTPPNIGTQSVFYGDVMLKHTQYLIGKNGIKNCPFCGSDLKIYGSEIGCISGKDCIGSIYFEFKLFCNVLNLKLSDELLDDITNIISESYEIMTLNKSYSNLIKKELIGEFFEFIKQIESIKEISIYELINAILVDKNKYDILLNMAKNKEPLTIDNLKNVEDRLNSPHLKSEYRYFLNAIAFLQNATDIQITFGGPIMKPKYFIDHEEMKNGDFSLKAILNIAKKFDTEITLFDKTKPEISLKTDESNPKNKITIAEFIFKNKK